MDMDKLAETRRENLRFLASHYGAATIGALLGHSGGSFISQMTGPRAARPVSERTARTIERALSIEPGLMDLPLEVFVPGLDR